MKALVLFLSLLIVPSAFANQPIVPCLTYFASPMIFIQKVANDLNSEDSELVQLINADASARQVAENGAMYGLRHSHIGTVQTVTLMLRTTEGVERTIGVRMDQLCESVGVTYLPNSQLIVK